MPRFIAPLSSLRHAGTRDESTSRAPSSDSTSGSLSSSSLPTQTSSQIQNSTSSSRLGALNSSISKRLPPRLTPSRRPSFPPRTWSSDTEAQQAEDAPVVTKPTLPPRPELTSPTPPEVGEYVMPSQPTLPVGINPLLGTIMNSEPMRAPSLASPPPSTLGPEPNVLSAPFITVDLESASPSLTPELPPRPSYTEASPSASYLDTTAPEAESDTSLRSSWLSPAEAPKSPLASLQETSKASTVSMQDQPPQHLKLPAVSIDLNASSPSFTPDESDENDEELTEQQLREMYDEEELDRFLHLFSAYVQEVRLPGEATSVLQTSSSTNLAVPTPQYEERLEDEDAEWTPVNSSEYQPSVRLSRPRTVTEQLAIDVLLPWLPSSVQPHQEFSYGRFKVALQRLFLALEPIYRPWLIGLWRLSTWKDWNRSAFMCSFFWVLWLGDFLLPTFLGWVLWSLLKRRLLPYPTLAQLRERRREVERAEKFGEKVSFRLANTFQFGLKDAWKLAKDFRSKSALNLSLNGKSTGSTTGITSEYSFLRGEDGQDLETKWALEDLQRISLAFINVIADLHERLRNIFLWRKQSASVFYTSLVALLFIGSIVFPTQWIAKAVCAFWGFIFWHVVPLVTALPPDRVPPLFFNVPTDTDYATELIARRVAAGLDVKPSARSKRRRGRLLGNRSKSNNSESDSILESNDDSKQVGGGLAPDGEGPQGRDWVKGAYRAANAGKAWMNGGIRLAQNLKERGLASPTTSTASNQTEAVSTDEETHPFLAQHIKSGPGMIILNATTFWFTPAIIGSASPKITVPLQEIRGVKKTGALSVKGLAIRRLNEKGEELQDRFLWVRGRDEVFARLVGVADKRWLRL